MSNPVSNQPVQQKPPVGFYILMGTVGVGLAIVIIYLIASYFAK